MNRFFWSQRRRALFQVLALIAVLFSVLTMNAQTATNIQVTSTVQASSVKRLGVNLADQTFYDSGQMLKNLVFQNPGFEPQRYRSIMICAAVSANTCRDDNQWSPQTTGFWTGASYRVLSGNSTGKSGTIVSSTAAGTCSACGQMIKFNQNIDAAVGDYFVMTQNIPGHGDEGWWDSTSGSGTITSETTDLSPETVGTQALALNASATGAYSAVTSYFDDEDGLSFIQLNGAFAITFRAKGIGGNNQLSINMQRTTSSGNLVYFNKTITLTNAWADYTETFSAAETGSASGTAQLVFGASGGSVELDDVSLAQTNSSASNPTAFRDDVVNALTELQPGSIRMMAGAALGSDLINQIQLPMKRYREGWSTGQAEMDNISYGIHEFLQLCQTVGADPWITIPTATTTAEMQAFIQYLTGTGSDEYSALRISRGQTAPWTSVFNKIHLELGNETWNGSFRGESMDYYGYPTVANTVFGAARTTTGYVASKFDLVLDGLAASPGYNQVLLASSTKHDSLDGAPYLLLSANNEAQSIMFGALYAEPELFDSTPTGEMYQNVVMTKTAPTPTYMNVYETNLSPIEGNITETQLNNLTPSIGAGLAHTEHMMQMQRDGVVYQNAFCLPQYAFDRGDGLQVKLWGITRDMGTTNLRRPQFLTQSMANTVIGGNMLSTVQSGANPTWNQPLSSDSVILAGAHYLQSFAYQNGGQLSVVIFNLNQTTALPVTFSGNAPSGSVTMTQITSTNITDNNETSSVVAPTTKTLSGFNPAAGLTLPPFSMTVLTSSADTTQAPAISPAAGTYTSAQSVTLTDGTSGAAIYYTLDGSTPTASSTKYTSAITISASETVNAIAVASGLSNSPVTSAAYVINTKSATAATPAFSVAGGTYSSAQSVTISDATSGAAIYYTTTGAMPTTSSTKYTGAISVSASETLKAIAVASGYTNSAVASAAYTIGSSTAAATPVFSVAGGSYNATQSVSISDTTSGAAIYYTTNGATPTTSSTRYSKTLAIPTSQTVKAIAVASGYTSSAVASAQYTLVAATPVFSVAAGSYSSAQSVTLSSKTAGTTIYYTTNGSAPTTSSTQYTGAISVSSSTTLNAIAVAKNFNNSSVATAAYTISESAAAAVPTFSAPRGMYYNPPTVTIASATSGAAIYYTTNGSTPTTSSAKYTGPVTVNTSEVIKAIAVTSGSSKSKVASTSYTLQAAQPVFSVAPGVYNQVQHVTLTDTTSGATFYYTTNGTKPTTSSAKYTGPIAVTGSETVWAIAVVPNFNNSMPSMATYSLKTAPPTFSVAAGSYSSAQKVTLTTATSGATIYYTTNGTTPTTSSAKYTGPVTVKSSETIKAMAVAPNFINSTVQSALYSLLTNILGL